MAPLYRISPLDPEGERSGFRCEVESLDRYFHERVTQDIRRRITTCFVARDDKNRVEQSPIALRRLVPDE